jgi:hypothetical protein
MSSIDINRAFSIQNFNSKTIHKLLFSIVMANVLIYSIPFAGIRMVSRFEHRNNKVDPDSFGKIRGKIKEKSGKRQSDRKLRDFISREMSEQIPEPFKRIKCKDTVASMTEIVLS